MVIVLYGSDSYRRTQRLRKLIEAFKEKYPTGAVERFAVARSEKKDDAQQEFLRLKEFCGTASIFGDKKMVVLEGVWDVEVRRGKKAEDAKKEEYVGISKDFKNFLKSQIGQENVVIISGEKGAPGGYTFLKGKGVTTEKFEELEGAELKAFVKNEAKTLGVSLTDEALQFLTRFYGKNVWGLVTELQKVSSVRYQVSGERKSEIDLKTLKRAGDYVETEKVFPFVQSLVYPGSTSQKLAMYEKMMVLREEPVKIFNILQSLNYVSKELLERLADYDIMVKSGKMEYDDVILDLIISG